MKRRYSIELIEAIQSVLDKEDIKYYTDLENGVIHYTIFLSEKEGGLRYIQNRVRVREDDFSVYTIYPTYMPRKDAEQMSRIAEFICRANFNMILGNFELDFNDGELSFKVSVDCEGDHNDLCYSNAIIERALHIPLQTMLRYSPGLEFLLRNPDKSPEEAIHDCEKTTKSSAEITDLLRQIVSDSDSDTLLELLRSTLGDHSDESSSDTDRSLNDLDEDMIKQSLLDDFDDLDDLDGLDELDDLEEDDEEDDEEDAAEDDNDEEE